VLKIIVHTFIHLFLSNRYKIILNERKEAIYDNKY
jgi:hypothetical protein